MKRIKRESEEKERGGGERMKRKGERDRQR